MINLKTTRELRCMRDAGKISQEALLKAGEAVRPGVSTLELDKIVRRTIEKAGAVPSFLGYGGFPASACISVNNVVIHGIPSAHEILKEGDIVSIDVGAIYEGFNGDNAWTFPCGKVSEEAQKLMDAIQAVDSGDPPLCGVEADLPHIHAVRLVQQNPITPVRSELVQPVHTDTDDFYCVKNLEQMLVHCAENRALPSELGIQLG